MSDFISNDSLKIRVNVDLQVMLKRAAELQGLTVESFVVAAIHDAAQRAIEQNALSDGSQVGLHLQGRKMTVEASTRPRYKLSELMADMTSESPRVEGWGDMPLVGMERD